MDSYVLHLLRVCDRIPFQKHIISVLAQSVCVCVLERESIPGTLLVNWICVDLTNEDESNILLHGPTVNGRASGTTFHSCDCLH